MSAVSKVKFTEAEYLAKENASDLRSEFYRGEIFAMTGGSLQHNRIKENLSIEIGSRLKGGKCQSFSSDQRVKVIEADYICYPDVLIVCDEPKFDATDRYSLLNPQVIIEVLSPSTERRDRIFKFRQFQQIPSLKEFVLVSQSEMVIEHLVKKDNDRWELTVLDGASTEFKLATIPVEVKLADIFAGLDIPERMQDIEENRDKP